MPVVSRSFEYHTGDRTILLSFTPILKGTPWERESGTFHLSSPSTNLTRGLVARRLLKVPPCRENTIHLQHPCLLRDSKPRPNSTAFSIANHYTGW
ncbi:hypothetical protein TNCV_1569081 [Trichonephila clavipes]|nr:hypothetical protein TNCV_1569081 [Trichonephila clavipes]